MRKFRRQHRSPLYQVAEALKAIEMEEMETIDPCILAPWEKRVQMITGNSTETQRRLGGTHRRKQLIAEWCSRNGRCDQDPK
jgi:hypothetical protein